jgi:hypothetical protein
VAKVYSTRLAELVGLGAGGTALPVPPAGNVWVVRNISAAYLGAPTIALSGFSVQLASGCVVWLLDGPVIVPGRSYDWGGRHVLNPGDTWEFTSSDASDWSLIVSGYQLLLP